MDKSNRRTDLVVIGCLILLAIGLYALNYKIPFYYDDAVQIEKNDAIKQGLNWSAISQDSNRAARVLMNYTLAINFLMSGLETWSYHLFNNIFHLLNCVLFFFFLPKLGLANRKVQVLSTLVFFLHPLQVEGVTYIMGRTELLKTLSTFILLHLYTSKNPPKVLIYLVLVLSLLIKETCALTPFLFIAFDLIIKQKTLKTLPFKQHLIYFSHWLWLIPIQMFFNIAKTHHNLVGLDLFPFWDYTWSNFDYAAKYLMLFLNPSDQSIVHEYVRPYGVATVGLGIIFLVSFAVLTFKAYRKAPLISFMTVFFFVSYLPNGSLLQFINPFSEYRLYQSNAAMAFFFAWMLFYGHTYEKARLALAGVFLVYFVSFHIAYLAVWQRSITLYSKAFELYPGSMIANTTLGREYDLIGQCQLSYEHYKRGCAETIDSHFTLFCENNLAVAAVRLGSLQEAQIHFNKLLTAYRSFGTGAPRDRRSFFVMPPGTPLHLHNLIVLAHDVKDTQAEAELLAEARGKYPALFNGFDPTKIAASAPCLDLK